MGIKRTFSISEGSNGAKRHKAAQIIGRVFRKHSARKSKPRASRVIDSHPPTTNQERKFFDTTINRNLVAATTADAGLVLNSIGQGTDNNQRLGRRAIMKHVQLSFSVIVNASAADDVVRWALVWIEGNVPGGTLPDISSVYDAALSTYVYGGRNYDNTQDLKVLRTGKFNLTPLNGGGGNTNGTTVLVDEFVALDNATQWNNTTAIAPTNGILVFYIAGHNATFVSSVEGNFRLGFIDV